MRRAALLGVWLAIGTGACGSTTTPKTSYVVVTVDARPAVHDAASITVALANAGTTRMDTLKLDGKPFPVTFSISAPGRTGDLAITVDASDQSGVVVGHGGAMTTVTDDTAAIMLDSTDFVVNTDYAGDQFPSEDFEADGFQLAALPDGTWTTAFRDSCMQGACNVFARRFDRTGKPVATQAAAGTNAFVVTARPTTLARRRRSRRTGPRPSRSGTSPIPHRRPRPASPAGRSTPPARSAPIRTSIAPTTRGRRDGGGSAVQRQLRRDAGTRSPPSAATLRGPLGDHQAGLHAARRRPDGLDRHDPGGLAQRSSASSADHVMFAWVAGPATSTPG